MQILIPILIACSVMSLVYAILFAYNREKYDVPFFLTLLGILIFNIPFIILLIFLSEQKDKNVKKVEEQKRDHLEKIISFMQSELGLYTSFRLNELKDSSVKNHRIVYLILKEKGYPDSKVVDAEMLYSTYPDFVNPSFDLEMKAYYGFKD